MKYKCPACSYVYDEDAGIPNLGIPPSTRWERIPGRWGCPRCRTSKSRFAPQQSALYAAQEMNGVKPVNVAIEDINYHEHVYELSFGQLSALCSALSDSCEKQYLFREARQFAVLAEYYKAHEQPPANASVDQLLALLEEDLSGKYERADAAAEAANDRGAKRILRWSKNVTQISSDILTKYKTQREGLLQNTGVYICAICGYIHIGDNLPPVCPVCKVANFRFEKAQ